MDQHLENLNTGAPTTPRPAASVILLRRGSRHQSSGLEVLFGRRTPKASFMANVWVFPGGAVDGGAADEAAYRKAALRELEEEVAISLDPQDLVPFSRWITPAEVKVRFDTHFYLAGAPSHCSPTADGEEIVEVGWFAPADALARHAAGELLLVFPTIKHLEALRSFDSVEGALESARSREIEPILPRVATIGGEQKVLLPGEPGY